MTRNSTLFIWLSLIVFIIEGVWMVFMGNIHTDESWWFYGSTIMADGYFPHINFISHHNPLFFFVYVIPQLMFGKSIIVGRLTSLFFASLAFFLTMKISHDRGGRVALVLCSILFITNIYCIWFYSIIHYQALQSFLLVAVVYVLFSSLSKNVKSFLVTLIATLIIGVRYSVDYCALLFLIYIGYNILRFRRDKAVSTISISTAILSLIALFAPFLILAPDNFLFNTITYIIKMESWKESLNIGNFSLIEILIIRLGWLKNNVIIFLPALVILMAISLKKLRDILYFKKMHGHWDFLTDWRYLALAFFILVTEVFYMIPNSSGFAQNIFVFPLIVLLAVIGFQKKLNLSEKGLVNPSGMLVVSLLFFSIFLHIPIGEQNVFAYAYIRSDIKNVMDVSTKIENLVPSRNGKILTFTPIYAGQANRRVVDGLEMEMASFFPKWNTSMIRRYHLINVDIIEQNIRNKESAAIVLTEKRFFEDRNYSKIIAPYRENILSLIHEHYYLAEKIDFPHSVYRGDVSIFLPR